MLIQILDVLLMNDAYHDNINDLYGIYDFSNEMVNVQRSTYSKLLTRKTYMPCTLKAVSLP